MAAAGGSAPPPLPQVIPQLPNRHPLSHARSGTATPLLHLAAHLGELLGLGGVVPSQAHHRIQQRLPAQPVRLHSLQGEGQRHGGADQ